MSEFFEVKNLLDGTAKDLTERLATVGQLRGWVVYLLEALEAETHNRREFEEMLYDLVEDINTRLDSDGW